MENVVSENEGVRKVSLSRLWTTVTKDYAVGIGLLLVVVFLWTSANFLTQDMFEDGYNKPFLLTYLNTGSFTLYLLPPLIRLLSARYRGRKYSSLIDAGGSREGYQPLLTSPAPDLLLSPDVSSESAPSLTTRQTAELALLFYFFWFIANWSTNAALSFTSVASTTILSSMSGFFTLILGRVFNVELLTIRKICAVFISFGGVVLVSLSDSSLSIPPNPEMPIPQGPSVGSSPIFGDALALLSALFYGLYVILLKVRIGDESRIDMRLFFGFVGLFNIVLCWPFAILLHVAGVEKFELPSTHKALAAILINMAITFSSDYIYVLAMLKTTPLVVTVGLSLTIPFAVWGDFFIGKPVQTQVILGALLVLIAFMMIGLDSSNRARDDNVVKTSSSNGIPRPSLQADVENVPGQSENDE